MTEPALDSGGDVIEFSVGMGLEWIWKQLSVRSINNKIFFTKYSEIFIDQNLIKRVENKSANYKQCKKHLNSDSN